MEEIIMPIVAQWGIIGVAFFMSCWIVYEYIKNYKHPKDNKEDDEDRVSENRKNINLLTDLLNDKLDVICQNIELMNDKLDSEIERLDSKIENQHIRFINELDSRAEKIREEHRGTMNQQLKIGPQVHVVMGKYLSRIKCDHIMIGSFHNGNSSVSGIPYYKYDIVAERFKPDKVDKDVEFAYMYKDVDILRHDKLPITLIQNEMVHYIIKPDKSSELSEIDDIIYRRLLGRDIKQISMHILRENNTEESNGRPIGFTCCVKYDYEDIDLDEFDKCSHEIEDIYNKIK